MPIYDYQCESCGTTFERICNVSEMRIETDCLSCGKRARQIFSSSGHYCGNQDAGWIKSVLDVVDKEDKSPVTRNFLQNPTRSNYKAWMKSNNIRPLEDGERFEKPKPNYPTAKELLKRLQERKRIEV